MRKNLLKFSLLSVLTIFLGFTMAFGYMFVFHKGVFADNPFVPQNVKDIINTQCNNTPIGPYESVMVGYIWPSPNTLTSYNGVASTNLFATAKVCANSYYNSSNGPVSLEFSNVNRTQGTGNFTPGSGSLSVGWVYKTDFAGPSAGFPISMSNLSPGLNCWGYTQTITANGWSLKNAGYGSFCINYIKLPQPGTIYVSKYAPNSHIANGYFADVPYEINTAESCMTNSGNSTFACNTWPGANVVTPYNGWKVSGIFANQSYKVSVKKPSGWNVSKVSVNGSFRVFSCSGDTCSVNVYMTDGGFFFVDFWYNPPPPSCSKTGAQELVTSPDKPGVSQNFSVDLPFNYSGPTMNFKVTTTQVVSKPTGGSLSNYGARTAGPYSTASHATSATFNNIKATVEGVYIVEYKVDGQSGYGSVSGCRGRIIIAHKPYLRVYSNDVSAGGAFKTECSIADVANPKATILTWAEAIKSWTENSNGPEHWVGASAETGVFALGEISEFSSAGQHSPRTNNADTNKTSPVSDLTFGNFNPSISIDHFVGNPAPKILDNQKVVNYGGNGGIVNCMPDYYDQAVKNGVTPKSSGFNASYVWGRTISKPIAEVVNGDAYVRGNISIGGSGSAGWSSTASIPSYVLVVRGNIYIQAGVSRIDGIYIAEPVPGQESTTGRIYTCARGNQSVATASLYKNPSLGGCSRKLTINGAFFAKQVKFRRSNGSLQKAAKDSLQNESSSSTNIAEVFNFTPELYIAPLPEALKKSEQLETYDFITSLPPIL